VFAGVWTGASEHGLYTGGVHVPTVGAVQYSSERRGVSLTFGRPLQETVRRTLRDRCPVCLSVTLVYCGQTVGWIKMPLGTQVGLGPGHIMLDGDPALLPRRGHSSRTPNFSAHVYCGQTVAHLSNC